MKRVLLVLVMSSVAALAADQSTKPITGWVSDSMCGAKHVGSGAACVKKCVEGGSKAVFVDDAKKEVWTIDNPDAVTGHLGHHISVEGTEDASAKTVHIAKVTMLKDQGTQGKPDEMGGMSH
jgi:hypothetical protein